MKILHFIETSPVRGDCTQSYDVETDRKHRQYTVDELIRFILDEQPQDFGSVEIRIYSYNGDLVKSIKLLEYERGKLKTETICESFEAYKNRRPYYITADGGWYHIDYVFSVRAKE